MSAAYCDAYRYATRFVSRLCATASKSLCSTLVQAYRSLTFPFDAARHTALQETMLPSSK